MLTFYQNCKIQSILKIIHILRKPLECALQILYILFVCENEHISSCPTAISFKTMICYLFYIEAKGYNASADCTEGCL